MTDNRPSKKQRELLDYIDSAIKQNGFGPSYREVMRALGYKSVSTVAVHVDGLIARGFLRKRDRSARSLEVVSIDVVAPSKAADQSHLAWLKSELKKREADKNKAGEAEALRAALAILDHSKEQ